MAIFYYRRAKFDTDQLSTERKFYIYRIIDPRTNAIIYIGKGSGKRWREHLKKSHNAKLNTLIASIRQDGYEPIVSRSEETFSEVEAYMKEVDEVLLAWENNVVICNSAFPGPMESGCFTGKNHTKEAKKKISDAGKNRVPIGEITRKKFQTNALNRSLTNKQNILLGRLKVSKFTEDLIRIIRYRFINDVHLSVFQLAKELGLKSYDIREIGRGKRFSFVLPETIPSTQLVKEVTKKRKSITSQINTLKIWQKREKGLMKKPRLKGVKKKKRK